MSAKNKIVHTLSCLLVLSLSSCSAQKKITASDTLLVQAKVWSKDEAKQVHYSDWKSYPSVTVNMLKGFKETQPQLDKYGGALNKVFKATGFFRTAKQAERWWVIDPDGHPVVITAVNSIRLGKSAGSEETVNEKFGNKEKWMAETVNALKETGFNTAGSWSDTGAISSNNNASSTFAYTTQLNLLSGYASAAKKINKQRKKNSVLSFILDDAFEGYCNEQATKIGRLKNDANLLGHFSDNELPFTHKEFDELLDTDEISGNCYLATVKWMKEKGIDIKNITREQKEEFIGWLAGKYYEMVSKAIRTYDPNHLYIGSRLHSSAKDNEYIYKAANDFVDIFSINYYGYWQPKAEHVANWDTWSSKPFFITEFYTKAEETGMSNLSGAGWIVKSQTDRGIHYQNFCLQLLQAKNCVGWHWFRYQDNDPADANADASNKDSNKGMVDIQFKIYGELIEKMKQLNNNKYALIEYFDQKK